MAVCTFFGHRDVPDRIALLLRELLIYIIEKKGTTHFLVGNQGKYDQMVLRVLISLLGEYPDLKIEVVLAYLPRKPLSLGKSVSSFVPDALESVPPRFAIDKRNRWMIDHSSIAVTYTWKPGGNAVKYKELAQKKGLTIFELS